MERIVLFRGLVLIAAFVTTLLYLHGPADAFWFEVTTVSQPVVAPLLVNLDGKEPPKGDQSHGLFAMPPQYVNYGEPRLKIQYRADFPISVTVETSGAIAGERIAPTGAMSFTSRIVFMDTWWSPVLSWSFFDFDVASMKDGRLAFGEARVRSGWSIRF